MNYKQTANIFVFLTLEVFIIFSQIHSMEVYLHIAIYQETGKITNLTISGSQSHFIEYDGYEIKQTFEAEPGDTFIIYFDRRFFKFYGTIIIEGYENPMNNSDDNFWHRNGGQDIYTAEDPDNGFVYYHYDKGYDHLQFTIPSFHDVSTLTSKGWGRYSYRFKCKEIHLEVNYNTPIQMPLSSMIEKLKPELIVEPHQIIFDPPANLPGTFTDSLRTYPAVVKFPYTNPSEIIYTATRRGVQCSTIPFYSYDDSVTKNKRTCEDDGQLYVFIKGEGCATTNQRCDAIECVTCVSDSAFIESDRTHCVPITSTQNGYYYDAEENLFKYCYTSCATCNAKGSNTEHKCTTCHANYNNYYLITQQTTSNDLAMNCYSSSCFDNGLFSKPNTNECFVACDPFTEYQYITSTNKACYTSCEDEGLYYKHSTNECLNECSGSHAYVSNDRTTCLIECEGFYYLDGMLKVCVASCTEVHQYEHPGQKQCVTACTVTPYIYIDCDERECVSECSGECSLVNVEGLKCVSSCNEGEYTINSKQCASACNAEYPYKYERDKTCLGDCNDDNKFTIELEYLCVDICDSNSIYNYTYIDDYGKRYCVNSCESEGLFVYGDTNTCVNTCKDEYELQLENNMQCVNTCPSEYKLHSEGNTCVMNCPSPYIYILPSNNQCVTQCEGTSTPLINTVTHYCVASCSNDDSTPLYKDTSTNTCVTECDFATSYVIYETKECVSSCNTNAKYPYITNRKDGKRECVAQCTQHPFILANTNKPSNHFECLEQCSDSLYGAYYQFMQTCVNECPQSTTLVGNICTVDFLSGDETNGFLNTHYTKDKLASSLNDIILYIKELNHTIQGSDYILQVYASNQPFAPNDLVSDLDFAACENILRQQYGIPLHEEIIIAKVDYVNRTSSINGVEYKAYTSSGSELNLMYCDDVHISVSYPLNDSNVNGGVNYTLLQEFLEQGIDLLNVSSAFYNDLCLPFAIGGYDVTLEDRRKFYHNDLTLCESNCEYRQMDFPQKKVNCTCHIKSNENTISFINEIVTNNWKEDHLELNVKIVQCYKLYTKWNYVKNSINLWIFSALCIVSIILCFICFYDELKKILSYMFSFCQQNDASRPHPPFRVFIINKPASSANNQHINKPHLTSNSKNNTLPLHSHIPEHNNINYSYFDSNVNNNIHSSHKNKLHLPPYPHSQQFNHIHINNKQLSQNNSTSFEHNSKITNNTISKLKPTEKVKPITEEIVLTHVSSSYSPSIFLFPIITSVHKDNYPFLLAIQHDNRSCCKLFFHFLFKKTPFIRIFYKQSQFELITVNFTLYILYIGILFGGNAVLYILSFISERFVNKGKVELKKQLLHSICALVFTFVVMKGIVHVVNVSSLLETVFNETKRNKEFMFIAKKMFRKIRKKLILFFIGEIIFSAICAYYLGVFNIVYKCTVVSWVYSVGLSLEVFYGGVLVVCVVVASCRRRGIAKYNKFLYNSSLWIDWAIW